MEAEINELFSKLNLLQSEKGKLTEREANLRTTVSIAQKQFTALLITFTALQTTSAKVHAFPLRGSMGRLYNCRFRRRIQLHSFHHQYNFYTSDTFVFALQG